MKAPTHPLRRVLGMLKAHRLRMLVIAIITFAQIGFQVLRPWPIQWVIDGLSEPGAAEPVYLRWAGPGGSTQQLVVAGAALVIIVLLQNLLTVGALSISIALAHDLVGELRQRLYGHLQKLSVIFHKRQHPGDLLKRVAVDTFSVQSLVNNQIFPTATAALTLVVMVVIMLRLDPILALVALGVMPALLVGIIRVSRRVDRQAAEAQEADSRLYQSVEEGLGAMPLIQATGQEGALLRRFAAISRESLAANLRLYLTQGKFALVTEVIAAAGTAALLILGVQHVQSKRLTVGELLVFLAYLAALYGPVNTIAQNICWGHASLAGLRRVFEFLDIAPDVTDAADARPIPHAAGDLSFENVSFSYETGAPILSNVSFRLVPGQRVAIVGATGSGKTTLLGLMARFFDPTEGRILLDGQDLKTLRLADLRSQVTLVLQDPILLASSVEENLLFGAPPADAQAVEAAARAACAHDFITRLPDGYKTVLSSDGQTLSGGQRQRLGVGRGLLRVAPIMLLDEPTSAMYAVTEQRVLEALFARTMGRTTLIVTHRLSLSRSADTVLVLSEGRIVEQGPHDVLMKAGGHYTSLARAGGMVA